MLEMVLMRGLGEATPKSGESLVTREDGDRGLLAAEGASSGCGSWQVTQATRPSDIRVISHPCEQPKEKK